MPSGSSQADFAYIPVMPKSPTDTTKTRTSRFSRFRSCLVADDRGRSVELLDPFRLYLSGRDDVIERSVLKTIINAGSPGRSIALRFAVWFAVALFVAMAGFAFVPEYLATQSVGHSFAEALRSPVIWWALGYGLLVPPWQLLAERRARRRHIAVAMLRQRRCPHCGYDLQGLDAEHDDNATVCPECAAAWKLDAASLAARAGDDDQARRDMVRFGIRLGIILTLIGLGMAMIYIL